MEIDAWNVTAIMELETVKSSLLEIFLGELSC